MRRRSWLIPLVLGAISIGGSAARADEPPPDVETCRHKDPGAACTLEDGAPGHCGDGTCSRPRRDGDSEYACFRCLPGAPPEPAAPKKASACAGAGLDAAAPALALIALGLGARRARRDGARGR